jgi:sulfofructose kinase
MKPLACVGSAVMDHLFRLPDLPREPGKYVAGAHLDVGGGPAATAAVTVARLGRPVGLIAPVGADAAGAAIVSELRALDVDTRWVHAVPGATSSVSAVLVDGRGERVIVNHRDPQIDAAVAWVEAIAFDGFAALLSDVRWPRGNRLALERARAAGVTTVLDGDVCPDDMTPLVALADHAAFSQPGLRRFTGESDPERGLRAAAARTPGVVYVTLGGAGCLWLDGGRLRRLPAFPVPVVDTTGAGDVFHGALLVAIADGLAGEAAVRFASAAAALKCTRPGGRDGIPTRQELTAFLAGRPLDG